MARNLACQMTWAKIATVVEVGICCTCPCRSGYMWYLSIDGDARGPPERCEGALHEHRSGLEVKLSEDISAGVDVEHGS